MRRAAFRVVPGRIAAITKLLVRKVPRPEFQQRVHPQVQVKHSHVRPDVADLLLTSAPHLFHIVKVLLNGGPVSN